METQYISLNMTPIGVNPCFHISQYDVGRMLGFIVHSGGATVDLDTYTCTVEATRSDGTAITSAVATTDNIGTFEVTPTMSNKADKYRCQLIIVDANSKRIASLPFDMEVTKAAMDENSEAIEEDASLYQQYTKAVQGAIAEANADIQAEENARIAAINAEATARQNADTTLQNNIDAEATARQSADNTLQGNINSEASTRATNDANLQSQINQIIAPSGEAPSAAEVENARIGADGAVYETLGDAIRTQNSNLKSALSVARKLTKQLTTSDIEQGGYNGAGYPTSLDTRIRTGKIAIFAGETVSVNPGTVCSVVNVGFFTEAGVYTQTDWFSNAQDIKASNDGYVVFIFRKTNSSDNISPSNYDATVTIETKTEEITSDLLNTIETLAIGEEININTSSSITTDIPIIAGLPYVFDTTVSGDTSCFVEGYSDDSVTVKNGVVGKTFSHSGKLRFYITSSRTITGRVYIDATKFNLNMTSFENIPSLRAEAIKKRYVKNSVYNTNRQLDTTGLTIVNYLSKVSAATYQYTFDPIRVRNSDGELIYNNLHIENLATLQNDQVCCYTFDKYGNYLRTVMFNTMVNRLSAFLSDEYFACLVEFPTSDSMKSMQWVVDNLNIEWLVSTPDENQVVEIINGKNFTISGSSSTDIPFEVKAGVPYEFNINSTKGGAIFVKTNTDNSFSVTKGINTYVHTFANDGVLRFYCTSSFTMTGNIKRYVADEKETYYVGTGKEFTTFTDMLVALKYNENEKTVYVMPGVYDIFTEMGGADFINSISDPSSKNWREVCNVVPPNTHIIGIGNVVLKWEPDAQVIGSSAMAFLFSPLNVSGNCKIENITVRCKNGRYAIHDEGSGLSEYDNTVHEFINVKAEFLADSTYSSVNAYGSGHNKGMKLYFDSCEFISDLGAFATHDNVMSGMGDNDSALIEIKNCVFKNRQTGSYCIRVYSSEKENREDIMRIYNSYFDNGDFYFQCPDSDGPYKQGYDVTMIGCTKVIPRYHSGISNPTAPKQYNAFE